MDADALAVVEDAFTWLAQGKVTMPPVLHVDVEAGPGEVDIKTAYVDGLTSFAVKVASGFFGNAKLGLPTGSGMMIVLSAETGFCEAVLLDNGYLTDLRTALAGAVAAKHLAPDAVDAVGVIGAGVQARYQVEALQLVRDFNSVNVFARNRSQAEEYATDMRDRLEKPVVVSETPAALLAASQLVVTTTPAREPVLRSDWIHPGLHITAMGSDHPAKRELDPQILSSADVLVADRLSQSVRIGELRDADDSVTSRALELGEITSGAEPGRTDPEQVTVCDLTGLGVQDTAIATYALSRLEERR